MKTIILTAALTLLAAPVMASDVKALIAQERQFDDLCRGTDNKDACIERQKLDYRLTGLGWCYGKWEQAAYQYRWHHCGQGSLRATVETLHSYDNYRNSSER
jgi:hypothetical protein